MIINRKRKLFGCIILVALLIGCASTSDSVQSWVGVSQAELTPQWGEPDKIMPNDPKGNVLIYSRENNGSSRASDNLYRYGSGTKESDIPVDAASRRSIYMFWVDNEGVIYRWTEEK